MTSGPSATGVNEEAPSTKQKGIVNLIGEAMYGTDRWKGLTGPGESTPMYPMKIVPRAPRPITLVIVALVGLTFLGMTLWNHDQINGITWAILTLAGTTVWGCLYMARR
jgi:hypothetical protein